MRWLAVLVCVGASAGAAYYGQPLVKDNSDAITIIVTVMTVFAGFLVAIIAVLGDPALIPGGSWRIAELRHANLENSLSKHIALFYIYLVAIGSLFAGVLIRKEPDSVVGPGIKYAVEFAYLFFGTLSFLFTLALPHSLGKLQLARSAREIEDRRERVGIKPHDDS